MTGATGTGNNLNKKQQLSKTRKFKTCWFNKSYLKVKVNNSSKDNDKFGETGHMCLYVLLS